MKTETVTASVPLELRESGARLHAVILQEGRVGTSRAEVFAPGSVLWAANGIAIRTEHGAREVARAVPARLPSGEIQIDTRATDEIRAAVTAGKRYMSIEFVSLDEHRTATGVRELLQTMVRGAALTAIPEYAQTRAEVRTRAGGRRRLWQ